MMRPTIVGEAFGILWSKRVRVGVAVAMAAAAVAGVAAIPMAPVAKAVLWSAAMLASFIGWGSVAAAWLAPRARMDWGLRAGWGMALFVLTGGFLCLAHIAVRPVLISQVGLGIAALFVAAVLGWRGLPSSDRLRRHAVHLVGESGLFALVVGAYGAALLTFLAFLGNHAFQPSDDPPFYFMLAEKLSQSGSLLEPYMARRVSMFGGQTYLHATFVSVASIYYLHVVDAGLGIVMEVGLLVGLVRGAGFKGWQAVPLGLALLVLFSLQDVRVNTNSEVSGIVAILTLFRTVRVRLGSEPDWPMWPMQTPRLVALAALALVCILLRISNAPAVLLFVGLVVASDFVLGSRRPWTRDVGRSVLSAGGLLAGTFVIALLPWAILQKESSGTFFYPFGHSHVTPGWTLLVSPGNWGQEGTELVAHLFYGKPIALFIPFVVAGLVPSTGRARNDVTALSIGCLVGLAVFCHHAMAFGPWNVARYYFSVVAGASLVIAASSGRSGLRAALVAAALGMHLAASREDMRATFDAYFRNAYHAVNEPRSECESFESQTAYYRDIQSHVPAGATIATAVFEGFRFDFKRNRIFALDVLGGMGPAPGWPAHKGPEALGEYLKANGVQYLVWVDFNEPSEFYNRAHWRSHLDKAGHYLQGEAVLQLDAEDAIEKLTAMRRVEYRARGMTVVDLGAAN
ncbi:MAG: hypothetical protein M3O46_00675 [Myxococcota bacterium]|nr:hypothetical protein [Myxococcota bacterium]